MKIKHLILSMLLLPIPGMVLHAQKIIAGPYLQDATPSGIHIMWETNLAGKCAVIFGTDQNPGDTCKRIFSLVNNYPSQVHRAAINNLKPATTYYYKVKTGSSESDIFHFTTPEVSGKEESFNLIAMSDMQRDDAQINKFKEIIDEGIIPFLEEKKNGKNLSQAISMVLVPGDLVSNGLRHSDWTEDFFRQAGNLLPYVPLYPVLGNHENNSDFYFNYFHLPDNGTPGYKEHWWYKDHGNVRIIGLNSNRDYRIREQLDWLQKVLDEAAADNTIDFVFAQLHHPHKSELWLDGETDYTGKVIRLLEEFSSRTGKPSIHFFGHTHGYSRGQSLNHTHLWINVATAGGRIDGWEEYAQTNYDEFSVSRSDYGFVFMQIEAGDNPHFKLYRISHGNVKNPKDNEVNDQIVIYRYSKAPEKPLCLSPADKAKVKPENIVLKANEFTSPDNIAEHGETEWQIARTRNFTNPDIDVRRNFEDWYGGVDLNAGIDLTEYTPGLLREKTTYYWRVRYRDKGLNWSDRSEIKSFITK